ncbi:MAG TPA: AAA family ATPase [Xanthobacteraceae bacterium]|nr:AAA family ATPase [Xanthobacteraceae bacterium]
MLDRPDNNSNKTRVAAITADAEFEQLVRATFGNNAQIELVVAKGSILHEGGKLDVRDASVVIVDLDAQHQDELVALHRLANRLGTSSPLVAVTQGFDQTVARKLLQIRIADFLVKPVAAIDLVRACARAAKGSPGEDAIEAQIYTFLPAAGGVGVTTLAIQTALSLLGSKGNAASVCIVDLDFQHGACADYLDLEPRLDLSEIEPRPERLDRQLLEVMLSHHASGLALIAAPNRPAEMRSFDPLVVTRLLDLVSANFDYVVIDMPRTWFSWTDSVLQGSNRLFIVSEMTVPGLRLAKQLLSAIRERLGESANPQVIVNRFEQRMFTPGLRRADIEKALGSAFAGAIPNNYRVVREAIDRGIPLDEVKPGNNVAVAIKKLVAPQAALKTANKQKAPAEGRSFFWAR